MATSSTGTVSSVAREMPSAARRVRGGAGGAQAYPRTLRLVLGRHGRGHRDDVLQSPILKQLADAVHRESCGGAGAQA